MVGRHSPDSGAAKSGNALPPNPSFQQTLSPWTFPGYSRSAMDGSGVTQVVIVGGGVVGASIAFHLSRLGLADILLLERAHLAAGATGICPGGIRQQFSSLPDCKLARRSYRFWDRVNDILEPESPFHFEKSGYLFLADSRHQMDRFRANVALQNSLGIPSRTVTPEEVDKICPGLDLEAVVGGSFCAEDGFVEDCHGVTIQLARRAERLGVRVVNACARGLARTGANWQVFTEESAIRCHHLVLANGHGSVELLSSLGPRLPIADEPRRLAFTIPCRPRLLPPLLVAPERGFAAKQLSNGVFYFGWLRETAGQDDLDFLEKGLSAGATVVPVLAELPVRRILRGRYDTTPDHRPILGPVDGFPNLHLAVGFSGHGFMIAPAVGEVIATSIAERRPDPDLESFSLSRFSGVTNSEGLVI